MKRLLGEGEVESFEYLLSPDEVAFGVDGCVYAVSGRDVCRYCFGKGCKTCNYAGEEPRFLRKRSAEVYPGTEVKRRR